MFFGTRIIWSIAVGSLWIATGACLLQLCWDRESRLIAESIKQGNTLFVFCLLVDYCLCVGHLVGSCCDCHTVFIVLLIVVLSISLYYLIAYFLQLFHLVEDEVLFGECNFLPGSLLFVIMVLSVFVYCLCIFMLQFDRWVGDG